MCRNRSGGLSAKQTTCAVVLSAFIAGVDGIASLNLVLTSPAGSEPASIQFTLTYPSASITSISVSLGPTAASAGKTVACAPASGAYTCLLYGLNTTIIPNGVVAVVNLTITAGVTIGIGNLSAASPAGVGINLFATGATVTLELALSVTPSSGLVAIGHPPWLCTVIGFPRKAHAGLERSSHRIGPLERMKSPRCVWLRPSSRIVALMRWRPTRR